MKTIIAALILMRAGGAWAEYYPPPTYQVFGAPASQSDENAIDRLMSRAVGVLP